jgi:hypothetical protein
MRLLFLLLLLPALALAQGKKKPPAKDEPKVLVALPLGIPAGKTTKVTLRGLKLDKAKEVRLAGGVKGTVKLLKKGAAVVPPQQDANKVGNTQVEVEITLPADAKGDKVEVVVETPAGASKGHALLLDAAAVVAEKEPNDGLKQAQKLKIGETVEGKIDKPQDVDVYQFDAKAGQKVVIEAHAARLGSPVDSFLTLYGPDGQVVEMNDDADKSTDSKIEATLKKAGAYRVSVVDAHDQGGPAHVYRLSVRAR